MRLSRLLIAKATIETIFVAALAAGYYLSTTPPTYRGWSEIDPLGVAGWVDDGRGAAAPPVEVHLYVDDQFFGRASASLPRADVVAAKRTRRELCGFSFQTSALGEGAHQARTFAVHRGPSDASPRALIPFGPTLHFVVRANKETIAPAGRKGN